MWLSLYREEREAAEAYWKAYFAFDDACDVAQSDDHPGVVALGNLAHSAKARWKAAECAIAETPATSSIGVAMKLAFWVACFGSEIYDDPASANNGDRALLSAWRSAVTLAGLPDEFGADHHKARHDQRAAREAA